MWLLRFCAIAIVAVGLCLATQPAAASPITAAPAASRDVSELLHKVHGGHPDCVIGYVPEWGESAVHRHLYSGEPVECGLPNDDDDDGDDDDDEGDRCIQVGPVTACQ
jgi:hypothetical protein